MSITILIIVSGKPGASTIRAETARLHSPMNFGAPQPLVSRTARPPVWNRSVDPPQSLLEWDFSWRHNETFYRNFDDSPVVVITKLRRERQSPSPAEPAADWLDRHNAGGALWLFRYRPIRRHYVPVGNR
jgi:hypothetical protein